MNKVLLVTAGLLLMPLPALSQGASDQDERGASSGRRDRELSELLRGLGDEGLGGTPRRGASFLLRSGDATIAVRCDPRESMRTCVELTSALLERARSAMSGGGAPATPPPRQ